MAKQPLENVVHLLFQIAARTEFKTLNDQELLKRYVEQRDGLVFEELARRYKGVVWHVCWRVLRNQDVEDAFQATFMTLIRRAKTILGHTSIEGWLHSTAFKIASTVKRNRRRQHSHEKRSIQMRRERFESWDCQWELTEVLDKELCRISEKYRSPLILCYLDEMAPKDAAQRLGISMDALKQRLHRGREQLKKRLSKYGMGSECSMLVTETGHGVQIPEIPPGLMEKTLEMVRIMTLSNGALETTGIPVGVATLVQGAMGMTLKTKVLLGSMLLSLVVVGAGAAKYAGILHLPPGVQQQDDKSKGTTNTTEEPKPEKTPPRVDLYGDPLPPGALNRLGTVRLRPGYNDLLTKGVMFTPDGKELISIAWKQAHLWDRATGKLLRRLGNLDKSWEILVDSMFSPNGKLRGGVQKRGDDNALYIWDADTGKVVCQLAIQGIRIQVRDKKEVKIPYNVAPKSWAFSPDSKSVLAFYSWGTDKEGNEANGHLVLWDIATGQKRWEQKEQNKGKLGIRLMESLAISPDGSLIAEGGYRIEIEKVGKKRKKSIVEQNIFLRDARTAQPLRKRGLGEPWSVKSLLFSPDGRMLLVHYNKSFNGGVSSLYAFDVATGREQWNSDQKDCFYRFPVFSPDGKIFAVQRNNKIVLSESATGNELLVCQTELMEYGDGSLAFSPDGKALARMYHRMIRCWDVATGNVLPPPPMFGHESGVTSVAFTADGNSLISGGLNQAVHSWDAWTARKKRTLREESRLGKVQGFNAITGALTGATASLDGNLVAGRCIEVSTDKNKSIHVGIGLWDASTGCEVRELSLDDRFITKLILSPNGKFLAVATSEGDDGNVSLWDVAIGKRFDLKIVGSDPIFSADSALLMTHKEGTFTVWEVATGRQTSSVKAAKVIEKKEWHPSIAVSPDWQTLAVLSQEAKPMKIDLYSLIRDQQAVHFGLPRIVTCPKTISFLTSLALSPDGKMLAWGGEDYHADHIEIHVLETATGKERICFTGHKGRIHSLSFSQDGRRLASGSADTTILIWDVTDGRLDDRGRLRSVQLSTQQVEQLWKDLLHTDDGVRAGRAVWTLAAAPKTTISFLAKHLSPVPVDRRSSERIAQLITNLDDEKFSVRKKAMAELEKLGGAAESSLRQALSKPLSVDVRRRVQQLLAAVETQRQVPSAEEIRILRAIEVLEQIGNREARQVLEQLSQGASGIRQTEEARAAFRRLQQTGKAPASQS